MKLATYAVACPIPEEGKLYESMKRAEEILLEHSIWFERPKLGRHITFIPPFRATEEEIVWLAAGLEVTHTFFSQEIAQEIMIGEKFDFFVGEKDALIVRLSASTAVRELVNRFRSWIPQKTEWVYPPESYLANFHATIGEGVKLCQAVNLAGGALKLFHSIDVKKLMPLQPPLVYCKGERGWYPVRM